MVLGELGGVVRKLAAEEGRVPALGLALVERGLGPELEEAVVARLYDARAQDVLDVDGDRAGLEAVVEDVGGRIYCVVRRFADRDKGLERGDAKGDARERRRGRCDACRPRLERGEAQLLRRGNRRKLRAEHVESRLDFPEREWLLVRRRSARRGLGGGGRARKTLGKCRNFIAHEPHYCFSRSPSKGFPRSESASIRPESLILVMLRG